MRVAPMPFSSAWLGILVLAMASGLPPSVSRGQDKNELPEELELSYEAFDQRPGHDGLPGTGSQETDRTS